MSEEKPRYVPTEADLHNSAFWEIQRFYRKCYKGKDYGKNVMALIRETKTAEELKLFLELVWPGASSGTRRKWAKAASVKYAEFA